MNWCYKSWSKFIEKRAEVEIVESTLFYQEVNTFLREQFLKIKHKPYI